MNKTNHSLVGGKSVMTYQLTSDSNTGKTGYEIGVEAIHIYNSFYNVSTEYNNNQISIKWLGVTYNFILPNGYYSVADLDLFIQNQCFVNNLYLTDGEINMYFIQMKINPVRYGTEINCLLIPSVLPQTYTIPANATWNLPITGETPQIFFNASFGKLIGFSGNQYYPATPSLSPISFDSNIVPEIHTVSSVIVTCNLVNNDKFRGTTSRNDVLFTFPINIEFGYPITKDSTEIIFNNMNQTQDYKIELKFYDQNFNQLEILDKEMLLNLVIKEKEPNLSELLTSLLLKPQQLKGGSFK